MGTYISQLELLVVFVALAAFAGEFRKSRGLVFVDNTPALVALVRGASEVESLDQITRQFRLASHALGAAHYYEYVRSSANWSDQISREGLEGA